MESKLEKLRERLLICPVCMDEYKDPRILPCHHSFCSECITKICESRSHSISRGMMSFSCPQCRKEVKIPYDGIPYLPINFYILNLQEELGSQEYEGECELCKEKALPSEFHCIECDKDICKFCIHSHRLNFHKYKPQIIRIQKHSTSPQPQSSCLHCTSHPKERMQLFCLTCNIPICLTCSCESHRKHNLKPLSEKLNDLRELLKSKMVQIDSDVKYLVDANLMLDAINQEFMYVSNKTLLALDSAASKACQSIMLKKSAIEKELLDSESKQLSAIKDVKKTLTELLISLHNGYYYLVDLQESDMCLEAYDTFQQFSLKLDKLRKDYLSLKVKFQDNHYSSPEYYKTLELPLGYVKNVFYFGTLGSLKTSQQELVIDSKTLETKKEPYSFFKVLSPYKYYIAKALLFWTAFFVFLLTSWIIDETEIFYTLFSFVKDTYEWTNAFVFQSAFNTSQYLQNMIYVEDPDKEDTDYL